LFYFIKFRELKHPLFNKIHRIRLIALLINNSFPSKPAELKVVLNAVQRNLRPIFKDMKTLQKLNFCVSLFLLKTSQNLVVVVFFKQSAPGVLQAGDSGGAVFAF
jgi:hypothetical protein